MNNIYSTNFMGQATTYLIHYSNRKGGCTMGNIIRFNKINQKEEDKTMEARKDFENLIKHLTKKTRRVCAKSYAKAGDRNCT